MILGNLLFGFVAIFHLAYLGVMFDSSSHQESVSIHNMGLNTTKHISLQSNPRNIVCMYISKFVKTCE